MPEIQHENTEEIIEAFDYPVDPHSSDDLYKLLQVLTEENKRIDIELNELYDNRFLDTATGGNLEKIGDLVGVIRKTDESDAKLRKRIRGAFGAFASDTTYNSFTSAALSILDAGPGSVEFVTPPEADPKTVDVKVDGAVLEENPLTEDELATLLNGALSVDARAYITVTGTFAFSGDDNSLEGFNEGTWSSGLS